MQDYDVTLKLLLQQSGAIAMRQLTGVTVTKWLDVELPKVQNLRLDLLGETGSGELIHVELQSTNDRLMPQRMAAYGLGVCRLFGQFPRQIVLYAGEAEMNMDRELRGPGISFRYELIDIRMLDGESLLASPELSDNLIAILARLRDHKEAIRKIVTRIVGLDPAARQNAMLQLLVLAGLRRMAPIVEQETKAMPIHINLLENEVLGPPYLKGLQEGRQEGLHEGRQEGLHEGRQEGELAVLRRLLEKRFGPLPSSVNNRLAALPVPELEELAERLLMAATLDELFG